MLLPCTSSAAMNRCYGLIMVRRSLYTFWANSCALINCITVSRGDICWVRPCQTWPQWNVVVSALY